ADQRRSRPAMGRSRSASASAATAMTALGWPPSGDPPRMRRKRRMMAEPLHDLLWDPLLRIRTPDGAEFAETLPGVLARLGDNDIASFPALQAHQSHAWFAFLVQLAGVA